MNKKKLKIINTLLLASCLICVSSKAAVVSPRGGSLIPEKHCDKRNELVKKICHCSHYDPSTSHQREQVQAIIKEYPDHLNDQDIWGVSPLMLMIIGERLDLLKSALDELSTNVMLEDNEGNNVEDYQIKLFLNRVQIYYDHPDKFDNNLADLIKCFDALESVRQHQSYIKTKDDRTSLDKLEAIIKSYFVPQHEARGNIFSYYYNYLWTFFHYYRLGAHLKQFDYKKNKHLEEKEL